MRVFPFFLFQPNHDNYFAVDVQNKTFTYVPVDGSLSHTHKQGATLTKWEWREGNTLLGSGAKTSLLLGVGEHTVDLAVTDSAGDVGAESVLVTVYPPGYPVLNSISPDHGLVNGDTVVTLTGSGFTTATTVNFGGTLLTGSLLQIFNDTTIVVTAPNQGVAVPVQVSVTTTVAESNKLFFSFVGAVPIAFTEALLLNFNNPACMTFGPDQKLYIGNTDGQVRWLILFWGFDIFFIN
jgi:IPT/TIG domain